MRSRHQLLPSYRRSLFGSARRMQAHAVPVLTERLTSWANIFSCTSLLLGNALVPVAGAGMLINTHRRNYCLTTHPYIDAVQVYDEPTVLVCYRVTGEEEVPEGVVGVLTPDAPDVLSHLSVRARNMKVRSAAWHMRRHAEEGA